MTNRVESKPTAPAIASTATRTATQAHVNTALVAPFRAQIGILRAQKLAPRVGVEGAFKQKSVQPRDRHVENDASGYLERRFLERGSATEMSPTVRTNKASEPVENVHHIESLRIGKRGETAIARLRIEHKREIFEIELSADAGGVTHAFVEGESPELAAFLREHLA